LRRGAQFATFLGLLAVSLGLLAPAASADKHRPKLTAAKAERYVRHTLGTRRLTPTRTRCHYGGGGFACQWRATRVVRGWQFHCRGRAWRGKKRASVQACRMAGPELAPLLSQQDLGGWQPSFGFNEDWLTQIGRIDLASGLGANTNRIPFNWALVEPERERFDWSGYDKVYNAMRYRHMAPILALESSPCWARPNQPCTPTGEYPPDKGHLDAWAHFVKLTVKRYPGIAGIEVWNEPNLTGFWGPEPSPKKYARLLKVTYKAVKSVNGSIPVIFGGLVPQFGPATRGLDSRKFQKLVYKAGGGRWVDAFAVHPYVFPSDDPNLIISVRLQMAVPKGIAAHFGYPGTPLWVTEFGLSTIGDGKLSPNDQATKLVALYQLLRAIPGVPVVILHRLVDLSPSDPDWQAGMGIVNYHGAPKPAYCALARTRTGTCPFH
jgi:hypothetical protein